jgi:hypothetical protein
MIDFQAYVKQRFKINGNVLLDNKVLIAENKYIKCVSRDHSSEGQSCVKELFVWSTGAGLNFFKSEKDVYKFIMSRVNNGVLYLTVNDTDMVLSEDPRGYVIYVICQTLEENNDYAKILKGKYFDHLSSVYIEILDTCMI